MKLLYQENNTIRFHVRDTLDFPLHLHNVLEIAFLRAGSATAVCGTERFMLEAGDVFLAFPNQVHGYESSRNVLSDVLIIPAQPFLNYLRNRLLKVPQTPVLKKGQWEHTGIASLLDMIRPVRHTEDESVLQGFAMVIVGKLLPLLTLTDPPANSDAMQRLLLYLSEHYREPIGRNEIARAVGYHESYISHLFTENLNTTMKGYMTTLRLQDARDLLTNETLTVSRISILLGFGSIRSFNRAFAEHFGMTPTQYREQLSGRNK